MSAEVAHVEFLDPPGQHAHTDDDTVLAHKSSQDAVASAHTYDDSTNAQAPSNGDAQIVSAAVHSATVDPAKDGDATAATPASEDPKPQPTASTPIETLAQAPPTVPQNSDEPSYEHDKDASATLAADAIEEAVTSAAPITIEQDKDIAATDAALITAANAVPADPTCVEPFKNVSVATAPAHEVTTKEDNAQEDEVEKPIGTRLSGLDDLASAEESAPLVTVGAAHSAAESPPEPAPEPASSTTSRFSIEPPAQDDAATALKDEESDMLVAPSTTVPSLVDLEEETYAQVEQDVKPESTPDDIMYGTATTDAAADAVIAAAKADAINEEGEIKPFETVPASVEGQDSALTTADTKELTPAVDHKSLAPVDPEVHGPINELAKFEDTQPVESTEEVEPVAESPETATVAPEPAAKDDDKILAKSEDSAPILTEQISSALVPSEDALQAHDAAAAAITTIRV
ncbi:hypothetical protein BKA62DRAFT_297381 [Auriculariales sp. MPI-PUGE-AT-0066]|nr:hypothetical protein BKA62DRAFT_297381 [Auriculariales sp. MPI-PUGE-AT-0066]